MDTCCSTVPRADSFFIRRVFTPGSCGCYRAESATLFGHPASNMEREPREEIEPTQSLNGAPVHQRDTSMGLAAGTRIGHYQIRKKLGSGGMGWVYEAADEKLERIVAINVLSAGEINEISR